MSFQFFHDLGHDTCIRWEWRTAIAGPATPTSQRAALKNAKDDPRRDGVPAFISKTDHRRPKHISEW
jgi:hypothetical protein